MGWTPPPSRGKVKSAMIPNALVVTATALLLASPVPAQMLKFEAPSGPADLEAMMPALADAALEQYREPDERKRLDTLFRLEMVAGRWADAARTLAELHARLAGAGDPQGRATDVQYQILVRAELIKSRDGAPFET